MESNGSSGRKLESFFAGKGFYIVLFLCAAVIGVSAWILMSEPGTDVELPVGDLNEKVMESAPVVAQVPDVGEFVPTEVTVDEPEAPEAPVSAVEPDEGIVAVWAPSPNAEALYVWPVNGEIEVPYAMTWLRYDRTMADWRTHDGIDIAAELGAHVMAVSAGTVESVYTDDLYGVTVVVSHGGGLKSTYSNLGEVPTVYEGSSVVAGEVIGAVGDTALGETGEVTHLHFSMSLDGESVDPCEYLP